MTPEILAFVLMPGAVLTVALIGSGIFAATDPRYRQSPRIRSGVPAASRKP